MDASWTCVETCVGGQTDSHVYSQVEWEQVESQVIKVRATEWQAQVENVSLLATPFGQALRALGLTCDDLRSLLSRSNLHSSQSNFFTVWSPIPSWVTSVNLLLANEIENSLSKMFFWRLACTCGETCESVWPPNASLYASLTCDHLRLLAGQFDQSFKLN